MMENSDSNNDSSQLGDQKMECGGGERNNKSHSNQPKPANVGLDNPGINYNDDVEIEIVPEASFTESEGDFDLESALTFMNALSTIGQMDQLESESECECIIISKKNASFDGNSKLFGGKPLPPDSGEAQLDYFSKLFIHELMTKYFESIISLIQSLGLKLSAEARDLLDSDWLMNLERMPPLHQKSGEEFLKYMTLTANNSERGLLRGPETKIFQEAAKCSGDLYYKLFQSVDELKEIFQTGNGLIWCDTPEETLLNSIEAVISEILDKLTLSLSKLLALFKDTPRLVDPLIMNLMKTRCEGAGAEASSSNSRKRNQSKVYLSHLDSLEGLTSLVCDELLKSLMFGTLLASRISFSCSNHVDGLKCFLQNLMNILISAKFELEDASKNYHEEVQKSNDAAAASAAELKKVAADFSLEGRLERNSKDLAHCLSLMNEFQTDCQCLADNLKIQSSSGEIDEMKVSLELMEDFHDKSMEKSNHLKSLLNVQSMLIGKLKKKLHPPPPPLPQTGAMGTSQRASTSGGEGALHSSVIDEHIQVESSEEKEQTVYQTAGLNRLIAADADAEEEETARREIDVFMADLSIDSDALLDSHEDPREKEENAAEAEVTAAFSGVMPQLKDTLKSRREKTKRMEDAAMRELYGEALSVDEPFENDESAMTEILASSVRRTLMTPASTAAEDNVIGSPAEEETEGAAAAAGPCPPEGFSMMNSLARELQLSLSSQRRNPAMDEETFE